MIPGRYTPVQTGEPNPAGPTNIIEVIGAALRFTNVLQGTATIEATSPLVPGEAPHPPVLQLEAQTAVAEVQAQPPVALEEDLRGEVEEEIYKFKSNQLKTLQEGTCKVFL